MYVWMNRDSVAALSKIHVPCVFHNSKMSVNASEFIRTGRKIVCVGRNYAYVVLNSLLLSSCLSFFLDFLFHSFALLCKYAYTNFWVLVLCDTVQQRTCERIKQWNAVLECSHHFPKASFFISSGQHWPYPTSKRQRCTSWRYTHSLLLLKAIVCGRRRRCICV